jgi:16S rRNA A1518/A1519 N6-dimethyltransferase RsmA/KsgA/DIM1 with predicted DNA glycosylase/AP lyase activity
LPATGADVVAVERDANLAAKLRQRFPALRVVEGDFLTTAFASPYAVVANPPFNRTAETMRRLFFEGPPPHTALLVLQREVAERYAASARLSAVALMLKPGTRPPSRAASGRRISCPARPWTRLC